jgi:hypothetical protein
VCTVCHWLFRNVFRIPGCNFVGSQVGTYICKARGSYSQLQQGAAQELVAAGHSKKHGAAEQPMLWNGDSAHGVTQLSGNLQLKSPAAPPAI